MLDNHGQRADALVNIHVGSYHARVLQSEGVVDVHVAGKLELRVPYFDDGHLGRRDADDLLHSIWGLCQWEGQVCERRETSLRRANNSASIQTPSSSFHGVVMQMSTK